MRLVEPSTSSLLTAPIRAPYQRKHNIPACVPLCCATKATSFACACLLNGRSMPCVRTLRITLIQLLFRPYCLRRSRQQKVTEALKSIHSLCVTSHLGSADVVHLKSFNFLVRVYVWANTEQGSVRTQRQSREKTTLAHSCIMSEGNQVIHIRQLYFCFITSNRDGEKNRILSKCCWVECFFLSLMHQFIRMCFTVDFLTAAHDGMFDEVGVHACDRNSFRW